MNETEKKVVRYIRNLRPPILNDGRIDLVETAWLVKAIHNDEDSKVKSKSEKVTAIQ